MIHRSETASGRVGKWGRRTYLLALGLGLVDDGARLEEGQIAVAAAKARGGGRRREIRIDRLLGRRSLGRGGRGGRTRGSIGGWRGSSHKGLCRWGLGLGLGNWVVVKGKAKPSAGGGTARQKKKGGCPDAGIQAGVARRTLERQSLLESRIPASQQCIELGPSRVSRGSRLDRAGREDGGEGRAVGHEAGSKKGG